MKKKLLVLATAALLFVAQSIFAVTTTGINFRTTGGSGFVTDAASDTWATAADIYQVTRAGITFGWASASGGDRDRDNTLDPELAGVNFTSSPTVGTFQVDLPATGSYDIRLAMGDGGSFESGSKVVLFDNATSFATIGPHDTNTAVFYDASDVSRTAAAWPGSNVAVNHTFTSTVFKFTLTSATGNAVVAHIGFAAAGGAVVTPRMTLFGVGP